MESILEGNILIAYFMGLIRKEPSEKFRIHQWYRADKDKRKAPHFVAYDESLEYHENWNWLMKAVEKIEGLKTSEIRKIYVSIDGNKCSMWNYFDPSEVLRTQSNESNVFKVRNVSDSKITATWVSVVEFIKWYNTQPKTDKQ